MDSAVKELSGIRNFALDCGDLPASVHVSHFRGSSGVEEVHLVVRPTNYGSIDEQMSCLARAYQRAMAGCNLNSGNAVFRRFFCSDLPNQAASLAAYPFSNPRNNEPCAISWVRQPPVPPSRVLLWAYHIIDPQGPLDKVQEGTSIAIRRAALGHHWTTNLTCPDAESSYDQTRGLFEQYEAYLRERNLTLADHVIRTWLFVQNIDTNYQGLVAARRELFAQRGLTAETHYIASSGIEGTHANVAAKVAMDAYSISGVRPEQIEFMSALDHLSPTNVYGVTFERGTAVSYRDRKHLFISGTASIDHEGKILHPGNVLRQMDRTLENVEALLKNSGATLADMSNYIVYLRDPSDYEMAQSRMREQFGNAPVSIVLGAVCRPGWLIEIEGIAIAPNQDETMPEF